MMVAVRVPDLLRALRGKPPVAERAGLGLCARCVRVLGRFDLATCQDCLGAEKLRVRHNRARAARRYFKALP